MIDFIVTDVGAVKISKESLAWLRSLDPNWWEILNNKRRRGRHAKSIRYHYQRFETAVMVAAQIRWNAGGILEEF